VSGWGWLGDGVGDLRELGGVALVAAVAGDGGGPGVLAAHLAPNLRRARDRVHLARVARARGVRGLQRAGGTLRHLLRGAWQPAPEPGVSQGRVGRHPGGGVPLQTPADEVEEQRVVAALQCGLQLPRAGRAARLASPRPPAVQHGCPVRQRRRRAVPRVAF